MVTPIKVKIWVEGKKSLPQISLKGRLGFEDNIQDNILNLEVLFFFKEDTVYLYKVINASRGTGSNLTNFPIVPGVFSAV